MTTPLSIAVVGMGGVFPGAKTLDEFWANIIAKQDATTEVPAGRWRLSPRTTFDPKPGTPDKVYSTRGCFIDDTELELDFDLLNLPPELVSALDPSFKFLLFAAQAAWRTTTVQTINRNRTGVIIGNIALPTEKASEWAEFVLGRTFEEALAGSAEDRSEVHPYNLRAPAMPAALLARALGLGGGSKTLDAACASSLYALKLACDELITGRADAMIAGGLSRPDALYTQMGFSQLRALSPTGLSAPFDTRADGLVVGEGAGLVILKRLDDAVQEGDDVLGVIRGIGLSNDMGGRLLAPTSEGQLRAMRGAYDQAGWSPSDVELIECHATGTPVGDAVEVESLRALWGDEAVSNDRCVLGSVKSNVGHLLTAAGAAAFIKTLLALRHDTFPPTANFTGANSSLPLDQSPFRVLSEAETWARSPGKTPRRAAVSAFGFGGIDAHVLVEEWVPQAKVATAPHVGTDVREPIAIIGLDAAIGSCDSLRAFQERVLRGKMPDVSAARAWGVPESAWFRANASLSQELQGDFIRECELPLHRFRIPPKELEDMLPQQFHMLRVAANAWADAGLSNGAFPNAGAIIGVGLDPNTTNFHVRWMIEGKAKVWARQLDLHLDDAGLEQWIKELRDAVCPPLTANRTMGALASITASRIARELHLGGASFTISAEENSALHALGAAVQQLRDGTLDVALAGAIGFTSDPRTLLAAHGEEPETYGDGAVAVVMKRLSDAEQHGDRIYAVIHEACVGSSEPSLSIGDAVEGAPPDYVDISGPAEFRRFMVEALAGGHLPKIESRIALGHTRERLGAATGLASFVKTALALYQEVLPATESTPDQADSEPDANSRVFRPAEPQYWLRNRADGPRAALVISGSTDDNHMWLHLQAYDDATSGASTAKRHPAGLHHEGLFVVRGDSARDLAHGLQDLRAFVERDADPTHVMEGVARRWHAHCREKSRGRLAVTFVARAVAELLDQIDYALHQLDEQPGAPIAPGASFDPNVKDRVFYAPNPLAESGKIGFVFPGSGNHFAGMGRDLFVTWPEILRNQDRANDFLREQFQPDRFWNADPNANARDLHKALIFGQVTLGTAVSDLVRSFSVEPDAVIGYSLGETAGLFALGAWTQRDEMLRRMNASPLFTTELAGDYAAAKKRWRLPKQEAVDWVLGVIDRPMKVAKSALKNRKKVYPLIANTLHETVIGGDRKSVERFIHKLQCQFIPLEGVTSVHCEIVKEVEDEYRELHLFGTTPPAGVAFYSGAWGQAYPVSRETAAESVLAQAVEGVDFPKVIDAAYADGVRIFLEMGPGNSCTRMITRILGDQPHAARALCVPNYDSVSLVLRALACLIAEGAPVNLDALYGHETRAIGAELPEKIEASNAIRIPVGRDPFEIPPLPKSAPTNKSEPEPPIPAEMLERAPAPGAVSVESSGLVAQTEQTVAATTAAHDAYLALANSVNEAMTKTIQWQVQILEAARRENGVRLDENTHPAVAPPANVVFTREQCMEFAIGSIGAMLGPEFAEVDSHPTRVRLPDEPLMLVDRITELEGKPRSLQPGRVVTEHDVLPDAWYLDSGRIAPCIAIEAGQADLFLSAYLGIDFETKGRAMYRLLDAEVTFHRELPKAGETICYDIRILRFFKHGATYLFRFEFDGTVNGEPLLTMREGCAGFFSHEELESGQGLVAADMPKDRAEGTLPEDWRELVPMRRDQYSEEQVDALREGNLAACFGPAFENFDLQNPPRLPGGRMRLVHRVSELDPKGGRYGIGLIRAEADIHPGDWFLTCHFVDDRVMPGTLMYECCLHTFRIFLMRMGWIGEANAIAWEPVLGVASALKCRGQVLETTKTVTYEVHVKELGYGPVPYAIADAIMYSDGKPIVHISGMCLQLSGQTREGLEELWGNSRKKTAISPEVLFTQQQLLEFAQGHPSKAFGEPYRPFDRDRVVARLPRPPYLMMSRVIETSVEPFVLKAGGTTVAEYDVPRDAWYFEANRRPEMPFAQLLEVALQPCGWTAAYMGAALASDKDLKFRNLGGAATRRLPVTRDSGTLTVTTRCTNISNSAGMILLHYDFAIDSRQGRVYDGTTYFGFFTEEALAQQAGIREAKRYAAPDAARSRAQCFEYPTHAPFPDSGMRMVDRITCYIPDGGPNGLGYIQGTKHIDPAEWFFKAHFYQDPVMPGSLGLEAFLQLLKIVAVEWWNVPEDAVFQSPARDEHHEWVYRGQVLPANKEVTVDAVITEIDDARRLLRADGYLTVDGLVIYEMKNFALSAPAS